MSVPAGSAFSLNRQISFTYPAGYASPLGFFYITRLRKCGNTLLGWGQALASDGNSKWFSYVKIDLTTFTVSAIGTTPITLIPPDDSHTLAASSLAYQSSTGNIFVAGETTPVSIIDPTHYLHNVTTYKLSDLSTVLIGPNNLALTYNAWKDSTSQMFNEAFMFGNYMIFGSYFGTVAVCDTTTDTLTFNTDGNSGGTYTYSKINVASDGTIYRLWNGSGSWQIDKASFATVPSFSAFCTDINSYTAIGSNLWLDEANNALYVVAYSGGWKIVTISTTTGSITSSVAVASGVGGNLLQMTASAEYGYQGKMLVANYSAGSTRANLLSPDGTLEDIPAIPDYTSTNPAQEALLTGYTIYTIDNSAAASSGDTQTISEYTAPGAPTTGNIVVRKATNPAGSSQSFSFTPSWGASFSLTDGATQDSGQIAPGTYSVTETPVTDWSTTTDIDPTSIVVTAGATTNITFTNTFSSSPPAPGARACAPVDVNGNPIYGVYVSDLTLFILPATKLYGGLVASADVSYQESLLEGRHQIVLDFNAGDVSGVYARDMGTIFTWTNPATTLYVWQPSLLMQPENIYGRPTDWLESNVAGAKFIQGVMITAQSFNTPKTFALQSGDDLSIHPLLETPAIFNQQSQKAFSCAPFVAHTARVISTDNVAWQLFDAQLVYQPYPEMTKNWTTEELSLGLMGYGHIREMNIAHISTADLTLMLTFDQWPTIVKIIPNSGGVMAKTKVTIDANKFKLVQIAVTSAQPFRLFMPEIEVKLGQWGRQDTYGILKPFGGPTNQGALV